MRSVIQQRPVVTDAPIDAELGSLAQQVLKRRSGCLPAAALRLDQLLPPELLLGVDQAVALMMQAIAQNDPILVVGDYDVDGATATALMVRCLRNDFGAQINFFMPSRFTMGYGLSLTAVEAIAERCQPLPKLLITVDHGIASHAGIERAQQLGIQVLVTDHHLPSEQPCLADAVVNPNQPGCPFPSRVLSGCGVAFYVLLRLRQKALAAGYFQSQPAPNLAQYLDWVALATVADVVPLDHNNRILVEQGLRRIRAGQASLGLQALLALSGREMSRLQSQDLAFAIAPRLNAAGRMEDMTLGVRCLLAETAAEAAAFAQELDRCNRERRQRQSDMLLQAAQKMISIAPHSEKTRPRIRVFWDADWHEGIVGLVAGQLKERLQQPVIALGPSEDGLYKGSARSIPGVHIRDVLAWVDAQYPNLLHRFGGHAMAAGLTLDLTQLSAFEQALAAAAEHCVPVDAWQSVRWVDGALTPANLNLLAAQQLQQLGPWGQGCPTPTFVNTFEVRSQRWLKEAHLKLTLGLTGVAHSWSAIWFYCPLDPATSLDQTVTLIYELNVNHFREQEQLQLLIREQVLHDADLETTILNRPLC